jgi:hypothetical protein
MKFSIFLIQVFHIVVLAVFILGGYLILPYINPVLLSLPTPLSTITINYWGFFAILLVGFIFISLIGAFFDGVRNSR